LSAAIAPIRIYRLLGFGEGNGGDFEDDPQVGQLCADGGDASDGATDDPAYNMHVLGDGVGDVLPDTERVLLFESSLAPEQVFRNNSSGAIWYFSMVSNDDFKIVFGGTDRVEARFKDEASKIALKG
jgi:hypothetical protein